MFVTKLLADRTGLLLDSFVSQLLHPGGTEIWRHRCHGYDTVRNRIWAINCCCCTPATPLRNEQQCTHRFRKSPQESFLRIWAINCYCCTPLTPLRNEQQCTHRLRKSLQESLLTRGHDVAEGAETLQGSLITRGLDVAGRAETLQRRAS